MLNVFLDRFKKHVNKFSGKKCDAVRKTIERAMRTCHEMFLSFSKDGHDVVSVAGPCVHIDLRHMLVDIGNVALQDEMVGENVLVRFATQDKDTSFYQFTTRIHSILNKRGRTELSLDLPDQLSCGQRRDSFRLSPPQQSVRTLYALRADDISFFPPNVGKESFLCDLAMPDWSLVDISATGMRIKKRSKKTTPAFTMQTKDRLLCYLELVPPDGGKLLRLWQLSTIAYSLVEEDTVTLGIRYKTWTEPVPDTQTNTWHKLDKTDYIDPLHRWVLRKQYKKRASLHFAK